MHVMNYLIKLLKVYKAEQKLNFDFNQIVFEKIFFSAYLSGVFINNNNKHKYISNNIKEYGK